MQIKSKSITIYVNNYIVINAKFMLSNAISVYIARQHAIAMHADRNCFSKSVRPIPVSKRTDISLHTGRGIPF